MAFIISAKILFYHYTLYFYPMPGIYVDVQLPLAVSGLYTYNVPDEYKSLIETGKRVIVPFGRNKIYSAVIRRIHDSFPDPAKLKDIQSVVDDFPITNEKQFKLWDWMAGYYMCTPGEVMGAAFPASLKLQSETRVVAVELTETQRNALTQQEETLLSALQEKNELSVDEIAKVLNRSSVHLILKKAFEKNLIVLSEEIKERFKPRKEAHLRLAESFKSESALEALFKELEQDSRKQKQQDTLLVFLKYLFDNESRVSVKKSLLLKHEGLSKGSLQTLLANGVLVEFDVSVDRIASPGEKTISPLSLNNPQIVAITNLKESFKEHDVSLLHGVTSSGKTEIYIHLIEEMIGQNKQVLYLLPEIALTTQLITRLQKYFGNKVGVYHSRFSSNERVEVWNRVLNFGREKGGQLSQVVIGARSALFLPFTDLGLVIVDEEHDQSFKQSDPAPRYNGRDCAIMLARIHGAKVLLGSATPSLESYFNAVNNRYGMVKLTERYGGIEMPEIVIADVKEAKRKKIMKSNFTPELIQSVEQALQGKEQVILFQNRRGFSNYIECRNCNNIPHCRNCSVTLTYHKQSNLLKCHYCGYFEAVPASCSNCGDFHLEVKGFGTEQIEEEIAVFFPEARIARMDIDSTRTKTSFQRIIRDFEDGAVDILVGTQMVTKGLDFDNVSTVGIINADQLLNFPDFRSFERSYQLMAQVSGRSGRKNKRGRVVIQTTLPDHWVIKDVIENNYERYYQRDIYERKKFGYPPHSRLIELTLKHKENEYVQEAAQVFSELLRKKLGSRILGPHLPLVSKIRNLYYRNILVKAERSASVNEIKKAIRECISEFYSNRDNLSVHIVPDVDPV
jgi:primosomal protein N' (replication factor Y)